MKTSPPFRKAADAFTLIELLVVITIIAILIGLLFPAFAVIREQTRKVAAHNDETMIVNAVKNYFVEYQKYPVYTTGTQDSYFGSASTAPTGATVVGTNDILFDVLRNNTGNTTNSGTVAALNPRGIVFLDVPSVKNTVTPISGVVPDNASSTTASRVGAWYDPWGSQYNVMMNTSYSNYLNNPYSDNPGGSTLGTTVIVWAYGKNGLLGGGPAAGGSFSTESGTAGAFTGSGDVISWQ